MIIIKTIFCVTKIKFNMYDAKDYSVLYNSALRLVICEGWHFTDMWKPLALHDHFTKRGGLGT